MLPEIIVQKDLHFYENIGKYNQFFMGWDDAELVIENFDSPDNLNIGSEISNYISLIDNTETNDFIKHIINEYHYNPIIIEEL